MDCYFRQYWRDQRLSFKGLKNNANNLVINQLRRVSKAVWVALRVYVKPYDLCVGIPILLLLTVASRRFQPGEGTCSA